MDDNPASSVPMFVGGPHRIRTDYSCVQGKCVPKYTSSPNSFSNDFQLDQKYRACCRK